MMLGAVAGIYLLYTFVLHRKFANWVVDFLHHHLYMDYPTANRIYFYVLRNNINLIFAVAIVVLFLIIFRIYLNRFTRYFLEINNGMDALVQEDTEDISLSPELAAMEKKMNMVKHTLEKRRFDVHMAEQRKRELVMYLAHDLKTPLASVIGYLNLLRDEGEISEELRTKYLSISLNKAQRLEDLINEFFEIARFNFSDLVLQYGRINLTRLLEQLVYEFQPMLKEKNLVCKLETPPDLMQQCDADKMQRVFDNLLRNAVLYSYEGTEIEITVVRQDEQVMIRFANQGSTIPREKLERIFDQFYRLDAARSTATGGAGLGLAIAKEIVEAHGGVITAASENERSVFTVTIPVM
ncbi:MAG: vancomycin resistance histidine kinase VanS [Lachnospiraceae bacterium]|nr:vancomycin resistance histidine kinase VanS [Lachnospiraceae bacterium]